MKSYTCWILAILLLGCQGRSDGPAKPAKPAPEIDTKGNEEVQVQGKPADHWVKLLQDKDAKVRQQAIRELASADDLPVELAAPICVTLLDPSEDLRSEAQELIFKTGNNGIATAVAVLRKGLKEKDEQVRVAAAESLGKLEGGAKSAVAELAGVLKDPNENVRSKAAWALGHIGLDAAPAVPALNDALKNDTLKVRQTVVESLSHLGPGASDAIPVLTEVFKDKNDEIRREAVGAVGNIGSDAAEELRNKLEDKTRNEPEIDRLRGITEKAVASLQTALALPDDKVRERALEELGRLGEHSAPQIPDIAKLLKEDKKHEVRIKAADALGKIDTKSKPAVDALKGALEDKNKKVALVAATVLTNVAGQMTTAVQALVKLADDTNVEAKLRVEAIKALGGFPEDARPAVPSLVKALKDGDPEVRQAAAESLKEIDPETAAKQGLK